MTPREEAAEAANGSQGEFATPSPNERDVSIMRAYVHDMIGKLPEGSKDEIIVGRRKTVAIQTPHLQCQLEVYFARFNGGSDAYTPGGL